MRGMQSVTLHMGKPPYPHLQHTRSQHTTVLGVSICHVRKNLQSFPVCRGLRLTAFLWKFMSQQLWSHPPVQTLKTTPSQELWGDPIHYTPPGNFSECACMYAHVSHLLGVSEHPSAWLTASAFLPSCARSCPTSCSFDCQHVCKKTSAFIWLNSRGSPAGLSVRRSSFGGEIPWCLWATQWFSDSQTGLMRGLENYYTSARFTNNK